MADIFDFSATPAANTSIDGINCNTGMPVQNIDNLFRSLAAAIRNSFSAPLETFLNGSAALPVASGGTGSTTSADARIALGLGTVATESTLPVAKGGTGATTASGALDGIGAIGVAALSLANPGYIQFNLPGTSNVFMVAWGTFTANANTSTVANYAASFPGASYAVVSGTGTSGNPGAQDNNPEVTATSTTGLTVWNADLACTCWYIAVGY